MSSGSGEKTKHPRSEGDAQLLPVGGKRQKITAIVQSSRSFLLDTHPEILRKVYSFLSLKEALSLRQVHRMFNGASNDIFQYSFIMNEDVMKNHGFDRVYAGEYERNQTQALCNLRNYENLRAVLRNETLKSDFICNFIWDFVRYSTTDNAQAVSILLQDGRCERNVLMLQALLRNDFIAMATALQRDGRVKQLLGPCGTCAINTGCYICSNQDHCVKHESRPAYCRPCVMNDSRFCSECNDYLCPACFEQGLYNSCEKCHRRDVQL